ncbi:MAG: acetyl xylan esterase, partial [Victivallales bacterium]|nr:acetyl xylan esterase [Victivallales bacterium]
GKEIASVTFIWMQGERDAKMKWGEVYGASLRGLIQQLGADLGRRDLNVVVGRLSDFDLKGERYPHWTMVREAQVKVAKEIPYGTWIDTDDLNDGVNRRGKKIANDLHYSAKGYKVLGTRFAEAAISLIRKRAEAAGK